jgi:hypothetical protein
MTRWLLPLVVLSLFAATPATYFPETIDSLWGSKHPHVVVGGVVATVAGKADSSVEFMLGDEHGHFVNCVVPAGQHLQPRVGVEVLVYGTRKVYSVSDRGQGVREINPVEKIEPVE